MKNVNEFLTNHVKLSLNSTTKKYQLYPYLLYLETKKSGEIFEALKVETITQAYYRIREYKLKGIKKLYLAEDFAPVEDIVHEFVAVFVYKPNKLRAFLIPYSKDTGEVFEIIREHEIIDNLKKQFLYFTKLKLNG